MNGKITPPPYMRLSLNLITIALLATLLYLGRGILMPLFFSILLAMLLHPAVTYLHQRKLDRIVAILLCIFLALCLIGAVVYFLSSQIGNFLDDIPTLKERLKELEFQAKKWIQENFNIGLREQTQYIDETTNKMSEQGPGIVQRTFLTLTEVVSYAIFLPVYTFLILYHKDLIKRGLTEMFKRSEEDKIVEVLDESQAICQQYISGMLIELVIVFVLNSIGFLILGIKYPVFLALVAALLNIVPYIGMLIANVFCVLITLVSSDPDINVLWVFVILGAVQIIDNNVLMPFIVGTRIRLNAMAIILGVVTGGALCGVAGMFLAIPGLAVMKIIFERAEGYKALAIFLGDDTTAGREHKNPIKHVIRKVAKTRKKKTT